MSCLEIKFLGISMKNPLVTSSGCFGFGKEYRDYFDPNQLGGIVLKGITLEAREGNYGVRIAETPGGMLNCVGLENPGIDVFEQEIIPNLRKEGRSEEHTSELQSRQYLVCRLLLEKKK